MPSTQLPNYLRSHRKRLGLSQDEVAFLLGTKSGARVCRDERFTREPSLETALAYEAIFQRPAKELFAGLFAKVEQDVVKRAKTLGLKWEHQIPCRQNNRKLEVLERIFGAPSGLVLHQE